jgi:hypothetical protein
MKFVTRLYIWIGILLTSISWSQSSNCSTTDKKINKALEEANNATNFEGFVQGMAAVVSKYPDNVQAYFYLGRIHYQQGMVMMPQNRNEAEKLLQKSLLFYQASIQKCPSMVTKHLFKTTPSIHYYRNTFQNRG